MRISYLILLFAYLTTNAFASDCFSLGSGYTPGKFDVSVMGEKGGLAESIIPIIVAAGAKSQTQLNCPACPFTTYSLFETNSAQSIMVRTPDRGIPGYQWNFDLAFTDGVQVNAMGPGFDFSGPVAEALYRGLSASNASQAGSTPGSDGQFNVPMYRVSGTGYALTCNKQGPLTHCSVYLEDVCKI